MLKINIRVRFTSGEAGGWGERVGHVVSETS